VVPRSGRLVAAVGVRDLVIVDTDDAVLVCSRERAQDVKKIVDALKERGAATLLRLCWGDELSAAASFLPPPLAPLPPDCSLVTCSCCGLMVMSWRFEGLRPLLQTGQLWWALNHMVMHSLQNWCPQTVKTPVVKGIWQMTHMRGSLDLEPASFRLRTERRTS